MNAEIIIERINNTEFKFGNSSSNGIRHVSKALTFKNPDPYAYSPKIEKFDKRKLIFKIGMLNTLKKYISENNIPYEITDYVYEIPDGVVIDNRMSGNYIHQKLAVESFFEKRFGIIVVPTRGGKTFIASEILRIFLENDTGNFLFCVDNTTLFTQAVNDIKGYFENYGGVEVGEIRAGAVDVSKRITVGMIQTIQSTFSGRCKDKSKKKELEKYIKELKFLCVDEIHDNCSNSKLKIYKKAKKLEYQLCLSATPYRAGTFVQNLKLMEWSGDVIYTISEQILRDRGVLSDYKVFMLLMNHNLINYEVEVEDYNGYRKALIFENELRNNILLSVIEILKKLNLKTLILFQSIEHGNTIENLSGIPFISGVDDNEGRESAKYEFLEGSGGFLLASNIFKKGVTISQAQVLINVDGGLEEANTIQKKGRVLGSTETKSKSLVIDFFDMYDSYFSKHSEARLNTYIKSIGEDNIGILDTSINDWKDTIEKWIENWFVSEKGCSDTL